MNCLIQKLTAVCRKHLLDEKWLLAPSLRAGHQWLDQVALGGQAAVNVRVKTLRSLALELAAPAMADRGLKMLRGKSGPLLAEQLWNRLKEKNPSGYLTELTPSLGLFEMIDSTLQSLRLGGLDATEVLARNFEVAKKGEEIKFLLGEYGKELKRRAWVDYAEVLAIATERVRTDVTDVEQVVLLEPADLEWSAVEKTFLDAFPKKTRLPVDEPTSVVANPAMFQAVGEVNEVREVLRRCLANGWRWDEVELLHTDAQTYVPLMFELVERFRFDDAGEVRFGVTFADGLPVRYSRPGRALMAWVRWIEEEYPQALLAEMIQDGLLNVDEESDGPDGFAELASAFRAVPVGFGLNRYLKKLGEKLAACHRVAREITYDEDGEVALKKKESAEHHAALLMRLRPAIEQLLGVSSPSTRMEVWEAADKFLTTTARATTELDQLARQKLQEHIRDLREWDVPAAKSTSTTHDAWRWLSAIMTDLRVKGERPQPGKLHVASIFSGGHSGRAHTFIVGVDDNRFPGAGLQDALLLDDDRQKLSRDLLTSSELRRRKQEQYQRLLGRLRGHVIFSNSIRSLADDREMFASPALLAVYRESSKKREADLTALQKDRVLVSFAPNRADLCLDASEWWMWRLGNPVNDAKKWIGHDFPHLARGWRAEQGRRSDQFTEFDGNVPEAGRALNPMEGDANVMSVSRLQTIGSCPLRFFFQYGLGLKPLKELKIEESQWLDGSEAGALMHRVFCEFMTELVKSGKKPQQTRDWPRLEKILNRHIQVAREKIPPPSESVIRRQVNSLRRMAAWFLAGEEEFCKKNQPRYMEVSLGIKPDGKSTLLDCEAPIPVRLADGNTILCRGRIDRVDEMEEGEFVLWDYKTGSTYAYNTKKLGAFRQGRLVQHYLYLKMAQHRLGKRGKVEQFGFFFPSDKEKGERIPFRLNDLAAGNVILQHLASIVANGAFLATNDNEMDCGLCDFRSICRDTASVAGHSETKMAKSGNNKLQPIRGLRKKEK